MQATIIGYSAQEYLEGETTAEFRSEVECAIAHLTIIDIAKKPSDFSNPRRGYETFGDQKARFL